MKFCRQAVACLALAAATGTLGSAQFGSLEGPPVRAKQFVAFTAEPQTIAAGRLTFIDLRFRINPGYHVNSHRPSSELLMPTRVELEGEPGLQAKAAEYPAGKPFTLPGDPAEKLDVYQDDFVVRIPVTAKAGEHELRGTLQYQACDRAACFPPRSLPLRLLLTAR